MNLLVNVGPFLYGAIGGAICCLAFFFVVFRKIEQVTANIIRKKALKHAEFESVARAAAEVPNTKVEALCKLVRFDNDIVGEAIQCRAVFYGSTIFFYAVDKLITLPDHTQQVEAEHLLGKVNIACVDVDSRRISKYHRHVDASQRHAPVKGKCTTLAARPDLPLFTVDPTVLLKERLEAAKEERKLLLRQLRKQVHAAARGDASAITRGPVNVETMHRLIEEEKARGGGTGASTTRMGAHAQVAGGESLNGRRPREECSTPTRLEDTLACTPREARSSTELEETVMGDASSAAASRGWGASLSAAWSAARRAVLPPVGGGKRVTVSEPWLDGDLSAGTSLASATSDLSAKRGKGLLASARSWFTYLAGLDDEAARRRARRGRAARAKRRDKLKRGAAAVEEDAAAKLAAMEKTLYDWRIVAIKFPTRRENERWLNLLQSTEQTVQWRDFIAHLPKHDVLNMLLARLFFESTRTSGLHDLLVKKIGKNLAKTSKSLPQQLKGNIYLDNLVVGGEVPLFSNVSDPVFQPSGELDVDFDVLYRGGLSMSIRFSITYRDIRVPDIIFHIKVLELAGRVRINIGPPPTEKLWLGGPRPPSLRLEFTQEVASHEGLLNAVVNMLPDMSKIMTNVVKVLLFEDMVLPSLDDFPWPVFDPVNKDVVTLNEDDDDDDDAEGQSDTSGTEGSGSGAGKSAAAGAKGAPARAPESKEDAKARKAAEKAREKQAKKEAKDRKKAQAAESTPSTTKKDIRKADTAARNGATKRSPDTSSPSGSAQTTSLSPKNRTATLLPTPHTPSHLDGTPLHVQGPFDPLTQPLPSNKAGTPHQPDLASLNSSSTCGGGGGGSGSVTQRRLRARQSTESPGEVSPEPVNPWGPFPPPPPPATRATVTVGAAGVVSASEKTGRMGGGAATDRTAATAPRSAADGGRENKHERNGSHDKDPSSPPSHPGKKAEEWNPITTTTADDAGTSSTAPRAVPSRLRSKFTTTSTRNNASTTHEAPPQQQLTADVLRQTRGATGPASSAKANATTDRDGGGGRRLPARRTSASLDALTVSTTCSERVRRKKEAEEEVHKAFPDAPVAFFSAGAGAVSRGGATETFVSRGAAVVLSSASTSRKTSTTVTPQPSAQRDRPPLSTPRAGDASVGVAGSAARGGQEKTQRGSAPAAGASAPFSLPSPTELLTVSDRASVAASTSPSLASTARSSRLPARLA